MTKKGKGKPTAQRSAEYRARMLAGEGEKQFRARRSQSTKNWQARKKAREALPLAARVRLEEQKMILSHSTQTTKALLENQEKECDRARQMNNANMASGDRTRKRISKSQDLMMRKMLGKHSFLRKGVFDESASESSAYSFSHRRQQRIFKSHGNVPKSVDINKDVSRDSTAGSLVSGVSNNPKIESGRKRKLISTQHCTMKDVQTCPLAVGGKRRRLSFERSIGLNLNKQKEVIDLLDASDDNDISNQNNGIISIDDSESMSSLLDSEEEEAKPSSTEREAALAPWTVPSSSFLVPDSIESSFSDAPKTHALFSSLREDALVPSRAASTGPLAGVSSAAATSAGNNFSTQSSQITHKFVYVEKGDQTGGLVFLRGAASAAVVNLPTGSMDKPILDSSIVPLGTMVMLDVETSSLPHCMTVLGPDSVKLPGTNPWGSMLDGTLPLFDVRLLRQQHILFVNYNQRKGMVFSEVLKDTVQGKTKTRQLCATIWDGKQLLAHEFVTVSSYNGCAAIASLLCKAHVSGMAVDAPFVRDVIDKSSHKHCYELCLTLGQLPETFCAGFDAFQHLDVPFVDSCGGSLTVKENVEFFLHKIKHAKKNKKGTAALAFGCNNHWTAILVRADGLYQLIDSLDVCTATITTFLCVEALGASLVLKEVNKVCNHHGDDSDDKEVGPIKFDAIFTH